MAELTRRTVSLEPSIERIKKWLESVVNNPQARRKLLILGTTELADRARAEPDRGLWNYEPGVNGYSWYQRRWGTRYRLKSTGRLGGQNNSEDYRAHWKAEIHPEAFSAAVFTNVSYAPFLIDPFQRVAWAEAHGWQDIDEIANDYAPRFEKLTLEYIDSELEKPI